MNGIEVLNTYEYCVSRSWGWSAIGTTFLVLAVLTLIAYVICAVKNIGGETVFYIMLFAFTFVGIYFNLQEKETTVPAYEVIINEDASAKELLEKYEIIDQEGKIYHIIDKVE